MKYNWKGHKDRNRHQNRINRSGQAHLVYVKNILQHPHHVKVNLLEQNSVSVAWIVGKWGCLFCHYEGRSLMSEGPKGGLWCQKDGDLAWQSSCCSYELYLQGFQDNYNMKDSLQYLCYSVSKKLLFEITRDSASHYRFTGQRERHFAGGGGKVGVGEGGNKKLVTKTQIAKWQACLQQGLYFT